MKAGLEACREASAMPAGIRDLPYRHVQEIYLRINSIVDLQCPMKS